TSLCQDLTVNPADCPNVSISNRCAANPKPLRPCSWVLTLKYPNAACIMVSSRMEGSRYQPQVGGIPVLESRVMRRSSRSRAAALEHASTRYSDALDPVQERMLVGRDHVK